MSLKFLFSCLIIDSNYHEQSINEEHFEIKINFGSILPPPETRNRNGEMKLACESKGLWKLSESKDEEHRELLNHPVVELYLWYKWKKLGWLFSTNMIFCLVYASLFTNYILDFDDKRCNAK